MTRGDARLLVVDDAPTRAALHRALGELGVRHIDEADDAPAARALLAGRDYHLLISGWRIGGELLRWVRQTPRLAALPVLIASGLFTRAHVVEAANAGASGFLARPFTPRTLEQKVHAYFGPPAGSRLRTPAPSP